MSLVHTDTGEVVAHCTAEEARTLTDRIKVGVDATWHLIKQAYEARAWAALGYSSWDDYCTREFGTSRLRLPKEERQEVVASLRESGLSIRAIEAVTGVSRPTVISDLRKTEVVKSLPPADEDIADADPEPPKITGTDGKKYKPTAAQKKPRRVSLVDSAKHAGWDLRKSIERVERVVADDRFAANRGQVATQLRDHLAYTQEACQDLLQQLRPKQSLPDVVSKNTVAGFRYVQPRPEMVQVVDRTMDIAELWTRGAPHWTEDQRTEFRTRWSEMMHELDQLGQVVAADLPPEA